MSATLIKKLEKNPNIFIEAEMTQYHQSNLQHKEQKTQL